MSIGEVIVEPFYAKYDLKLHEIAVGVKYPQVEGWYNKGKSADEVELALCDPNYNKYGWILGPEHLVVDIDVHNPEANGYASLTKLEAAIHCSLKDVCGAYVNTPSGGRHYYFLKPEGLELSRCYQAYPGIDFLDGGKNKQVIAAGSRHDEFEGLYTMFGDELLPAPEGLLDCLASLNTRAQREREEYDFDRDPLVGDVFMRSWDGVEYLKRQMEQMGYSFRLADDYYEYNRPGKTTNSQRSGHLGKQSENGNYHLTSFTLSDPTFPSNQAITIFHAYALLKCNGDEAEASRQLSSVFNTKVRAEQVFDKIVADKDANIEPDLKDANVLKPERLCDVSLQYPDQREVLIEGVLRRGEVMNVIASPKTGKSWLLNQLMMSVATGADWIGHSCRSGRVLLIDNELHRETHVNRFNTVRNALQSPAGLLDQNMEALYLRGRQHNIFELAGTFASFPHGYYSLIAIDAMYRCWPKGTSENSNADVTMFYNTIDAYAKMTGAAIVLVHHTSKGDQTERGVTDVGSGAGAISRAADTHCTIRPHEKEGHAVLDMVCRSFKSPGSRTLAFSFPIWESSDEAPVMENAKAKTVEKNDHRVIAKMITLLHENGADGMSRRKLREAVGCSLEVTKRCIEKACDEGLIMQDEEPTTVAGNATYLYRVTAPEEGSEDAFLND